MKIKESLRNLDNKAPLIILLSLLLISAIIVITITYLNSDVNTLKNIFYFTIKLVSLPTGPIMPVL